MKKKTTKKKGECDGVYTEVFTANLNLLKIVEGMIIDYKERCMDCEKSYKALKTYKTTVDKLFRGYYLLGDKAIPTDLNILVEKLHKASDSLKQAGFLEFE